MFRFLVYQYLALVHLCFIYAFACALPVIFLMVEGSKGFLRVLLIVKVISTVDG